jgi:hypothetical protein
MVWFGINGWSLLPDALRPFEDLLCFPVYYFPASPISVANRRNRSLGHVRIVEALQNFVQKCNPVIFIGDSYSITIDNFIVLYILILYF